MSSIPHANVEPIALNCGIITVSDTRTVETDRSGQLIQQLLTQAGHSVALYRIIPDEPSLIQQQLTQWCNSRDRDLHVLIFSGGTGIAPRDTTYDALLQVFEKTLPGFGELFRSLSYGEIGSRAIASRAVAGIYHQKLIFSLPGSTNAVKLGMEKLILPELVHLFTQLNPRNLPK